MFLILLAVLVHVNHVRASPVNIVDGEPPFCKALLALVGPGLGFGEPGCPNSAPQDPTYGLCIQDGGPLLAYSKFVSPTLPLPATLISSNLGFNVTFYQPTFFTQGLQVLLCSDASCSQSVTLREPYPFCWVSTGILQYQFPPWGPYNVGFTALQFVRGITSV